MKKLLIVLMLVTFAAAVAYAADTVTYEGGKQGKVTFNHKAHGEKFDCAKCHDTVKQEAGALTAGAADKNARKKAAHALCKDCHKKEKAPTGCSASACHVK